MVLFQRYLWVSLQTGGVWCQPRGGLCQLLTDHLLRVIIQQYNTALCLPITISCLSWLPFDIVMCGDEQNCCCQVAAQYVCNFLGCKVLQVCPHLAAWDQEGLLLAFLMLTEESHTLFTMHHPMHLPTENNAPSTKHLSTPSLVPRLFFWNETTMLLSFTCM